MFFSSDGHVGFGQLDVFGTIIDDNGKIRDVVNLGKPLNSEKDDFGFYALENGLDGYVSSNRKGGKGSDDIYRFKYIPSLAVEGFVTDAFNARPLDSVQIALYDQESSELIAKTVTDEKGYYQLQISRNKNYTIEASRSTHPSKNV